jgi:hypothetical protein
MTSETELAQIFSHLSGGRLQRIKKEGHYAFIHFTTRDGAEMAFRLSQNLLVGGSKLDVHWSKPVDKAVYNIKKQICRSSYSGPT